MENRFWSIILIKYSEISVFSYICFKLNQMGVFSWLKSKLVKKEETYVDSAPMKDDYRKPSQPQGVWNYEEQKTQVEETPFVEKAKDFLEDTRDEVVTQGKEVIENLKEKWQVLDDETKEVRENLKNKANEALQKLNDLVDKTIEHGKNEETVEKSKDADQDGFSDKAPDFGEPVSQKHEGFFEKAENYLKQEDEADQVTPVQETPPTPAKPTLDLPQEDDSK
ncbi:MAG: hypothetical protein IPO62_16165 [Saprospiraceae bacterium]|nr:hypothetical protein [Saprospiraceae bacterium]